MAVLDQMGVLQTGTQQYNVMSCTLLKVIGLSNNVFVKEVLVKC